ncbi:MAG TPA: Clp protease N-terminal domain-containing protein [Candidatus Dormibacteraeota bacterium]|nr:Clp protease N-terminal domain-containing protein [Candidatus Dormibacteraeota bacterium]
MPDATAELDLAAADIPLTRSARDILDHAASAAKARGASASPNDVLQAILSSRGSLAYEAIGALGVDPSAIIAQLPSADGAQPIPIRQLLVNANREAQVLGHYQVDSIHLLLAMLYSDSPQTSGPLQKAGLTLYDLRRHLQAGTKVDFQPGESDRVSGNRSQQQVARTNQPAAAPRARPDAALRRKPLPSMRGVLQVSPVFYGLVAFTAAAGALLWFGILPTLTGALTIAFVTAGWITSVCVHEFGHAIVAYLGGDRSVRASGYLDLNPLRYTNVLLSLVMPVLFLLLGGIGLPGGAVYIDRGALRSRAWDSAVSVAGPAGTLVCGLIVAIPFFIPGNEGWLNQSNAGFFGALAFLGFIEVIALVLNLLPVPGLDGYGIIRPWLPYTLQGLANQYGQLGILAVFGVLWFVTPVSHAFFQSIFQITTTLGIDPRLIDFGRSNMRFS